MFVRRKKYDAVVTAIAERNATLAQRDATIGRLQRENARLLSEISALKARREKSNANLKQNKRGVA